MDALAFVRTGYGAGEPADSISRTGLARGRDLQFTLKGTLAFSAKPPVDDLRKTFLTHAKKWRRDTRHFSSPADRYLHPSYARIIGLGRETVPHILRAMQRDPDDWFYALRAITGANPVTSSMAGNMKQMTDAWLKWGATNGLV